MPLATKQVTVTVRMPNYPRQGSARVHDMHGLQLRDTCRTGGASSDRTGPIAFIVLSAASIASGGVDEKII